MEVLKGNTRKEDRADVTQHKNNKKEIVRGRIDEKITVNN